MKRKISAVLSRSADKLTQTRGEYISPAGVDAVGALVIAGNLADWENGTLEAAYGGDWHTASYKCGDCAPNNYTLREYLVHLNDKHEWTFGQIAAHLQGRYGL